MPNKTQAGLIISSLNNVLFLIFLDPSSFIALSSFRRLQLCGYFGSTKSSSSLIPARLGENEIYIGSLLVHFLGLLSYNTHAVLEQV